LWLRFTGLVGSALMGIKGADWKNYKRSSTQLHRCRPWCKTRTGASFV